MWQKSILQEWLINIAHAAIVVGVAATVQVLFLAFILVVLGAGDWGTAMAKLLADNR